MLLKQFSSDFKAAFSDLGLLVVVEEEVLTRGSGGFGGGLEGLLQRREEDLCVPNFRDCFTLVFSEDGEGWCIIGGFFGESGEGKMIWFLKTALLKGFEAFEAFSLVLASMED